MYKQSTAATTYCASSFRTSQKLATVQRSCDIVIYIPKLVQPLNPMQLRGAGPLLCSPSWPDTPTDSHLATNCFHQIFSSNLRGVRDGQWSLGEAFRVQKCSSNAKIYPRKSTVNAKAPPSLQRKVSCIFAATGLQHLQRKIAHAGALKLDANQVLLVCAYSNLILPSFCPLKLHRTWLALLHSMAVDASSKMAPSSTQR